MNTSLRALACVTTWFCTTTVLAQLKPPLIVPGKEYITEPNTDAFGAPVTGQIVGWDGFGFAFDSHVVSTLELDATAHMGDGYFEDLIIDEAAMILSFRAELPGGGGAIDPSAGGGPPASYWYQNSTPFGGTTGVWATAPMLIRPPMLWGMRQGPLLHRQDPGPCVRASRTRAGS